GVRAYECGRGRGTRLRHPHGRQHRLGRFRRFGASGAATVRERPLRIEKCNRCGGFRLHDAGMFLAYPGEFVTIKPLTDAARTKTPNAKAVLDKVPFASRRQALTPIKHAPPQRSLI